jgi:hypothetical protein
MRIARSQVDTRGVRRVDQRVECGLPLPSAGDCFGVGIGSSQISSAQLQKQLRARAADEAAAANRVAGNERVRQRYGGR